MAGRLSAAMTALRRILLRRAPGGGRCRSSDLWFVALVAVLCIASLHKLACVISGGGLAGSADVGGGGHGPAAGGGHVPSGGAGPRESSARRRAGDGHSLTLLPPAGEPAITPSYLAASAPAAELDYCGDPASWAADDTRHLAWVDCAHDCIVEHDVPQVTSLLKPNLLFERCACECMRRHARGKQAVAGGDDDEGASPSSLWQSSPFAAAAERRARRAHPLSLEAECPVEAHTFRDVLRGSTELAKTFYVGGRSMPAWASAARAKGLAQVTDSRLKRTADFYHDYSKQNANKAPWAGTTWGAKQRTLQFWNADSRGFHDKARFAECTRGLDNAVPATFQLPQEARELQAFADGRGADTVVGGETDTTWVFKPTVGSGGYGVQRVHESSKLLSMGQGVAQAYIPSYLLDGRKFDLRLYVAVTSLEPLQAYLHTDGMVRLAYSAQGAGERKSANGNTTNCTFITNISQRKNCVEKGAKEAAGLLRDRNAVKSRYVWRIPALQEYIDSRPNPSGRTFANVWEDIEVAVALTLLACKLRDCVSFRDLGSNGARSYFTLGFDVAVDPQLHVWVMEVNQRPDDNSSVGPRGMFPDSPYLQGRAMQKFSFATLGLLGLPGFDRRSYGCSLLRLLGAFCAERVRRDPEHVDTRGGGAGGQGRADGSSSGSGCSLHEEGLLVRAADEVLQLDPNVMHQVLPLRRGSAVYAKVAAQLPADLWAQYQQMPSTRLLQPWLHVLDDARK